MLKKLKELQIPVFMASQTLYGRVNPYVYNTTRQIAKYVEFLDDILPETAYVKLSHTLSLETNYDKIIASMKQNMAGEFSKTLTDQMFLN